MITELLLVSLAAMISWEMLRYITPVEIPVRLAPFIIVLTSLAWSYTMTPSLLMAFAATAGVSVVHRITGASGIEPWSVKTLKDWMSYKVRRRNLITDRTRRIPDFTPSVGRRIPRL